MSVTLNGAAGLQTHANSDLGTTEWKTMTFEDIVRFGEVTGDMQWIHVDRERALKESPFGAPIAHGYFTLALVAGGFMDVVTMDGFKLVINYGTNKVRFPNPLKEGARWRLNLKLGDVTQKKDWFEGIFVAAIEIDGEAKPACVAECVYRFLPA